LERTRRERFYFVALNRSRLCGFPEGVAILGQAGKSPWLCRQGGVKAGGVVALLAVLTASGKESGISR
jgi:hypothetical protein